MTCRTSSTGSTAPTGHATPPAPVSAWRSSPTPSRPTAARSGPGTSRGPGRSSPCGCRSLAPPSRRCPPEPVAPHPTQSCHPERFCSTDFSTTWVELHGCDSGGSPRPAPSLGNTASASQSARISHTPRFTRRVIRLTDRRRRHAAQLRAMPGFRGLRGLDNTPMPVIRVSGCPQDPQRITPHRRSTRPRIPRPFPCGHTFSSPC